MSHMLTEAEAALPLERLPPGVHRELYALWLMKRDPDRLPSRRDFDPVEMPRILPHITLFDVETEPMRFRIRLVGTAIVEAMGVDTTGKYLDELPDTKDIQRRAAELATNAKPYFLDDLPLTWTHRDFKLYSVLGLPLASDGATVDMLLYSMVFD